MKLKGGDHAECKVIRLELELSIVKPIELNSDGLPDEATMAKSTQTKYFILRR